MVLSLRDTARRVMHYFNAVKRKYKNKNVSVIFERETDSFHIEVVNYDPEGATTRTSVRSMAYRGKVRISQMYCSRETFEAIVQNGIEMLEQADRIKRGI